jgi:hypothetical protein
MVRTLAMGYNPAFKAISKPAKYGRAVLHLMRRSEVAEAETQFPEQGSARDHPRVPETLLTRLRQLARWILENAPK